MTVILVVCGCVMPSIADTFDIPKVDSITIDGKDDDWTTRGFRVGLMNRWKLNHPTSELTGDANLRVAWDDRGLLLLLACTDKEHLEHEKHWKLDAVELFLFEAPGSKVGYQAVIAPGMDKQYPTLRWKFYTDTRPKGAGELTLEAVRTATDAGYLMEVRLPWSNLGIKPSSGQSIGFQIMIDDADISRERQDVQFVCWFADINTSRDSAKAHRLRLSIEDANMNAIAQTVLAYENSQSLLKVHTLGNLAGKPLIVKQAGKTVGRTTLNELSGQHLSYAQLPLQELNPDVRDIELYVDDQLIDRFGFYQIVPDRLKHTLDEALRTHDEKRRFKLMRIMLEDEKTGPMLRADLENLILTVDGWANNYDRSVAGRFAYPDHYLHSVCTPGVPMEVRSDSPVYPIYCLYRARSLIHWVIERYGVLGRNDEMRNAFYGMARSLLKQAQSIVPDNRIVNMYLDQPIPWPATFTADANAPIWANEQRVAIEKLTDIIHWWIANRQLPNGSYGGDWGDDCEMWRIWAPILIGFDDPVIAESQRLLSEGMFNQEHMSDGYNISTTDVEHSSEDSADTITPMLHLNPNNMRWREHAMHIAGLMDKLWTGVNQHGHRQYKSVVLGSRSIGDKPIDACDTIYHPRVVQPSLLLWQRTHDPYLTDLFTSWLDNWVAVTASDANGKPAGIVPSAIHWPQGTPGGITDEWWRPGAFRDSPLYAWPSSMSMLLNTLLLGYHITGNEQYLQPIRSMAQIRQQYLVDHPTQQADITQPVGTLVSDFDNIPKNLKPGSLQWCAAQLNGPLNSGGTLAKYRFLTGDSRYDAMLLTDANGYIRYRLFGDKQALIHDLRTTSDAFRTNREAFTSEVRFTDRVFRFPLAYQAHYSDQTPSSPDLLTLYSSITGDPGDALYFPMNAVKWLTSPREIAVLVDHADNRQFHAQLYHFGQSPRSLEAILYQLKPGKYTLMLQVAGRNKPLATRMLTVDSQQTYINLTLPARQLCTLTID